MELHVAFYRGSGGWKNKIIRWWTKSPYSHVELVLPDNETWISISPLLTSKVAMRTRKEWDPKQWELVKLDITEQQLLVILEFYESTKGCSYDWVGMFLSQFLPFHIKRKGKWYCSEWIAYALRISCIVDWRLIKIYDRADLSPAVLYQIIQASKSSPE
tara:strand:- start:10621 stop:11097 length:477 start_codon:yes stop_codon:yes gene_type:complete